MRRSRVLLMFYAILLLSPNSTLAAEPAESGAIPLPQADRNAIEAQLGHGVVGAAVPGKSLPNTSKLFPLGETTWTFRFVSGKKKGTTQKSVFTPEKKAGSGPTARLSEGPKTSYFVRQSTSGDLSIVSEQDRNEDVIVRYGPPEPLIVSGISPGESRHIKIGVKVYDLGDPSDLTHQGSLDVTYSYVGAYTVTVPAGAYEAALIKWHYTGSVGPANIEDTQYRFFADGVGIVASVDKKDITAMLVYNDHSKFGKVLVKMD